MPHRKAHENISVMILGHKYTKVHRWLDGTFNGKNWRTHRVARHHRKAIRRRFKVGSGQYQAAMLHVFADLMKSFNLIYIPENEEDVKRVFSEHGVM